MKKVFFIIALVLMALLIFSSCHSKSKKLAEEKKQREAVDSISRVKNYEDSISFLNSMFLTGTIQLSEDVGEKTPRIYYGFHENSDYRVAFILMGSSFIDDIPKEAVLPSDLGIKIRNIVGNSVERGSFYFYQGNYGYLYLGSFDATKNDPIDIATALLNSIEKETKWKTTKDFLALP